MIVVTFINFRMNLSTIAEIKTALKEGLLTTRGAIYYSLIVKKGARPCELSEWLELPASTVYSNLRTMELKSTKMNGAVTLGEDGELIRERPGVTYAVK
jgi:hypothetical protein